MKQTERQAENAELFVKWLGENKPHISMKDKTEYRNVKTSISFFCTEHGEYIAQPKAVKAAKLGCRLCSGKSNQLPFEDFEKRAKEIHGDKYEYDKTSWRGSINKTKIFCKACNDSFEQTGNSHLSGSGCPICDNKSRQLPFDEFVKKAKEIHGEKYAYNENSWEGSRRKTQIFCRICQKSFEQLGYDHIRGRGCPACNTGGGADNEKNFICNPELANEPCKLYYIKIHGLYKIGITKNIIAQRYGSQKFETLLVRETTRLFAWRAEQLILSEFSEHKQKGDIKDGYTECFATDISTLENFHEIFNHDFTEPIQ